MIFGKSLKEVEERDIQRLVNDQIEENINLDYKKEIDLSPKGRKELCKDVSAFANSRGGVIIYGIEEKKNELGIPVPVDPIAGIDADIDREQVENILLNSIQPRLHFEPKRILLSDDPQRCVFIISIPQSLQAPHMVTKDKDNRYYKRFNYSSVLMEEYEVRDLFQRNAQMKEKISEIEKQRDGCLRDPNNDEYPWICMLFIPAIPLENLFVIDKNTIQSLRECVRTSSRDLPLFEDILRPGPTGLIGKKRENQRIVKILEIEKNGVLEWGSSQRFSREKENLSFQEYPFTVDLINFLHFAGNFYEKMNYYGFVQFLLGFNNVRNCPLIIPFKGFLGIPEPYPIEGLAENTLQQRKEFLASMLLKEYEKYSCDIMNEFFNAFGEMKSPHFDGDGNFIYYQ